MINALPIQMRRRPLQTEFHFKTHGGKRAGAGRKRAAANVGLQKHEARDAFDPTDPVHVTMRAVRGVPSMRAEVVSAVVVAEIRRASEKGFRILHYSIQTDHLHLITEADSKLELARGVQRLAARVAMRINALARRRGMFWRERYHRRDLGSPQQFRNALVYVTFNSRKHASAGERAVRARELDGLSSARWIPELDWAPPDDTFLERLRGWRAAAGAGPPPVAPPERWVARTGWKKHGRLDPFEAPKLPE